MLIIWGYLLLIVVAGIVVIIFGAFLLRLLSIGISLFLIAEIITTCLAIFGYMDYSTGWTISKWAFFIGSVIGIAKFIRNPSGVLEDTSNMVQEFDEYVQKRNSKTGSSDNEKEEYGFPCCGNCKWNYDRASYEVRCFQDSKRNKTANEKCGQWQHY